MKYLIYFIVFYTSILASAGGLEYELNIKQKSGAYSAKELMVLQSAVDILKIPKKIDINLLKNNKKVITLFKDGELRWESAFPQANLRYFDASTFYYDKLCYSAIDYYISTNQNYLAINIYKKLIKKTQENDLVGLEAQAITELVDIYFTLGQIESAKKYIDIFKLLIDDYFEIDYDEPMKNGPFDMVINSKYQEMKLRFSFLENNLKKHIKDERSFFDLLIKYYEHNFKIIFMGLVGNISAQTTFSGYDKELASKHFYYQNYELMYLYAKIFYKLNDTKRGDIAYRYMKKALKSNASGSATQNGIVKQNSIARKEMFSNGGLENISDDVLQRVVLKYNYFTSLYQANLTYILNNNKEAKKYIKQAKIKFKNLINHYKKLSSSYQHKDKVIQTKRELLTLEANIYEKEQNYKKACNIYDNLILSNENIRDSLPLKLRRSYFRGYAKDAYLGLIRAKAKIYKQEHTKKSFEALLSSIDLLSSRQLKDLQYIASIKEPNLYNIQQKLDIDELIYIIFDIESDMLIAGISKKDFFASIIPKDDDLDKNLYSFKSKLLKQKVYDKELMKNISKPFTKPIDNFKKIKHIHILRDGIVSMLPFDIYMLDDNMIFDKYSVDYLTTFDFSILKTSKKTKTLLAVADPVYDDKSIDKLLDETFLQTRSIDLAGYFVRLPETREEVKNISKEMDSSKLLLGANAKESKIKTMNLMPYNYIHFATHGILGGELPDMNEVALVLAKEDGEDSLLSASEIAKLKLDASLVVLSACNSGNGKYFRGEGITGIARAFKIAGSKEIVASLWPVNSMATTKLMEFFYKYISKGYTNSKALYNAKKELQNYNIYNSENQRGLQKKDGKIKINKATTYKNPFYWSAFILIQ